MTLLRNLSTGDAGHVHPTLGLMRFYHAAGCVNHDMFPLLCFLSTSAPNDIGIPHRVLEVRHSMAPNTFRGHWTWLRFAAAVRGNT